MKKSVLITGSSRGIGKALAIAFGKAGYRVAVHCHKQKQQAIEVAKSISDDTLALDCDVRDSLRVRQMIDAVVKECGSLDVLINNAGITRDRTILKMTNGEWNEVIDTNLTGAFWCLREAARAMSEKKKGAIVNVASIMGVRAGFGNANYAASKAGLIALTKGAARELGRFGIAVNAVLPGFHPTEMAASLSDSDRERIKSEQTLGKFTDINDLARFVVDLVGNTSISGQVFNVDSRIF